MADWNGNPMLPVIADEIKMRRGDRLGFANANVRFI
jgi:hypothetical protein